MPPTTSLTPSTPPAAHRRPGSPDAPAEIGWRGQMLTVAFGAWVLAGLFVDGWAHTNRPQLETFFTPWHAVFYSGFATVAGWMLWLVERRRRSGCTGWTAVPRGYELGLAGLLLFAAGGLSDLAWHSTMGIERDIEALLSPPHLLLFLGLVLILSSPLRAAWSRPDPAEAARPPTLSALAPALLSLTLVTALCSFLMMYLSAFTSLEPLADRPAGVMRAPSVFSPLADLSIRTGIASILTTTVLLVAPLLLLLRRWQLPFGSAALLFTLPSVLLTGLHEFRLWPLIPAALVSGLLTDGVIRLVHAAPGRAVATQTVAAAAALLVAGLYLLTVKLVWDTWWSPALSSGVVVLAGLTGLALALLTDNGREEGV